MIAQLLQEALGVRRTVSVWFDSPDGDMWEREGEVIDLDDTHVRIDGAVIRLDRITAVISR